MRHDWRLVEPDCYSAAKLYFCPGCLIHHWFDWYEETREEALASSGIPEDCEEALVRSVLSK